MLKWGKVASAKQARFFYSKGYSQIRMDASDTRERHISFYPEDVDIYKAEGQVYCDSNGGLLDDFFENGHRPEMLLGPM